MIPFYTNVKVAKAQRVLKIPELSLQQTRTAYVIAGYIETIYLWNWGDFYVSINEIMSSQNI